MNTTKQEHAITQAQKFLRVLLKNSPISEMSEDVLAKWIENPSALRKTLRLALIPSKNTPELKAWKTIKLGIGPTNAADFLHLLEDVKLKISSMAKDMMAKPEFTFSAQKRDVDLVIVTTADLGSRRESVVRGSTSGPRNSVSNYVHRMSARSSGYNTGISRGVSGYGSA